MRFCNEALGIESGRLCHCQSARVARLAHPQVLMTCHRVSWTHLLSWQHVVQSCRELQPLTFQYHVARTTDFMGSRLHSHCALLPLTPLLFSLPTLVSAAFHLYLSSSPFVDPLSANSFKLPITPLHIIFLPSLCSQHLHKSKCRFSKTKPTWHHLLREWWE